MMFALLEKCVVCLWSQREEFLELHSSDELDGLYLISANYRYFFS
uniref:Uncharacterized protein n=1 Tax=Rhizophora mucronata TaxID=61149 RepID=A0A2P2PBK9_RHIMU